MAYRSERVDSEVLRALANDTRLDILRWLKDPTASFEEQAVGSFDNEGVCVSVIQERAGLSQPAISAHLKILFQAGLVSRRKIGPWQFYKRDDKGVQRLLAALQRNL